MSNKVSDSNLFDDSSMANMSNNKNEKKIEQKNGVSDDKKETKEKDKDYYFDSYSHFGIHEEMLKDHVRTGSYEQAIVKNPHLFRGKVVLDIGCGTGILSMFAAKAGAKKVYGIDMASIAEHAMKIVKENGFEDVITIIRGKVEDIKLDVKVDIIISEWMGYFLLYESMLNTVLYARDKWLKKDGLIMPDEASLFCVGIEDGSYMNTKIHFWDSVYGFKMSSIKEQATAEPLVDSVERQQIITNETRVYTINLYKITLEELKNIDVKFTLENSEDDYLHAFVFYFDVKFNHSHVSSRHNYSPSVLPLNFNTNQINPVLIKNNPSQKEKDAKFEPYYITNDKVGISTAPYRDYTHWKQSVFYLDETLMVKKKTKIDCHINIKPNKKNHRDLDITIDSTYVSPLNSQQQAQSDQQQYKDNVVKQTKLYIMK